MNPERTLDDNQVRIKAAEALEILSMHEDDSFAPTNAVRCVSGYDELTAADREAINAELQRLIG